METVCPEEKELYDSGIKVPLILYVPEKYQNFDKTIKFDNRLISFGYWPKHTGTGRNTYPLLHGWISSAI